MQEVDKIEMEANSQEGKTGNLWGMGQGGLMGQEKINVLDGG